MALKKDISRIQIGGDGKISFGDEKEDLIDLYRKNEENAKNQSNFLTKSLKTAGDPLTAIKNGTVMQQSLREKAQNSQTVGNNGIDDILNMKLDPSFSQKAKRLDNYNDYLLDKMESERQGKRLDLLPTFDADAIEGRPLEWLAKGGNDVNRGVNTFTGKTMNAFTKGALSGGAEMMDSVKANAAGALAVLDYNRNYYKPDENGMSSLAPKKSNTEVFTDAKIDELLFGKSYAEDIQKAWEKNDEMVSGRYGDSGAAMKLWESAMESEGRMLPSHLVSAMLGGTGIASEIAGALTIGIPSDSQYMKEAAYFMMQENERLQKNGKAPKYSKAEIRQKAAMAGINGFLIEGVGEYALGGLENTGKGFIDNAVTKSGIGKTAANLLTKTDFGKHILNAVTNPVGKTILGYAWGSAEEGIEEVIQGIAGNASKKLYDDEATVFSKENWKEYLESGAVGAIMGGLGGSINAVSNTVNGLQTVSYVSELARAAESVKTDAEAADVSAILKAQIGTLDDIIGKAKEKSAEITAREEKTGETETAEQGNTPLTREQAIAYAKEFYPEENREKKNTKGAEQEETPDAVKDLVWARDRLETVLSALSDKKVRTEIKEQNTDAQEAAKNAAEGAEPFRVRNWVEERQNGPIGQKMKELGVTNVIVDDALTYNDKRTGMIHIAEGTDTEEAADISMGHEVAHLAIAGDKTFVSDMKEAMRGIGMDVEALRRKAKDTYRVGLSYEAGMTKEEAERLANDDAYADEEIVSEFIGEMNRDGSLIEKIANEKPNVLRKVYDTVVDLVDRLTGKDTQQRRYQRLAEKIRRALKKIGYDISGKTGGFAEQEAEGRRLRLPNTEDMNVPAYGEQRKPDALTETEKNAVKKFGLTDNFAEAGYIMPDGSMLNFSNDRRRGEREYDHRTIAAAYGKDVDFSTNHGFSEENGKYLESFVDDGNIRIDTGDLSLNMDMGLQLSADKPITKEQEQRIKELVRWNNEREEMFGETASDDDKAWHNKPIALNVEFGGDSGYAMSASKKDLNAWGVKNLRFEGKSLNPDRVVNEIRNFYETGETREIPDFERFLYRLSNAGDIFTEYEKPITVADIEEIRSIGKKSINDFTEEDIRKTQKWAYKFWNEFKNNGVNQTKSPFFRAWFGDWRQYDTKTQLNFIPVNNEKISAQDVSRKGAVNKDTGWEIVVNRDGIDETAHKKGLWSPDYHSLKTINETLQNAILMDSVVVSDPSKRLGENAAFVHHMYCPVMVDDKKAIAKLYIAEEVGNRNKFYLTKIETVPTDSRGLRNEASSQNSSVDTDISIAELYSIVKSLNEKFEADSDKPTKFEPKPVNKSLLNDDGTPKKWYHQTDSDFTVFDLSRNGAGTRDNETPFGIFLKSSGRDIGLRGKKQMPLYAGVSNILEVNDRENLRRTLNELSPEYAALSEKAKQIDKEYSAKAEEAKKEFIAYLTKNAQSEHRKTRDEMYNDPEFQRVFDAEDAVTDEWTEAASANDLLMKREIENTLNKNGYDAIYLKNDEGSFGRTTDALIVLDNTKVKSAENNIGTFDGLNPDIRYRMKSTEDNGVKSYAEQDREYAEAVESEDTEKQKQLVAEAAKAAGYDSPILYHGTPNGTFNVFRNWNYFTENKEYAEVYQGQGASSNGYKKTANRKRVYQLYANLGKVFDTRKAKERRIFQNEFFGKWGNGTPLSERGIPDWTDANDLIGFFEENGYDYDTILLDEGKTGGYGEEIRDRGISYLIKNSSQLKSAEPVEYDDDGNVIPLSERFNSENDDIRYRLKSTEDNGVKSYADQRARQLAAEAGIDIDNLRNDLGMNDKPKERKKRPRSTTSNRAIQEKFAQDIRLEQMMNRKDWDEMTPVEREFAEQKERRFWEQSGYTMLHPDTEDDAMTEKLMHDFDSGLWGDPSSIEAGIRMWEIMAKSGYKPAQETLDSLRKTRAAKIAEQRMTEAQKEAAKRAAEKAERPAREAEEYRKSVPMPTVDTTADGEPAIDTTFGEADQPQTWQERLKAEEEIAEREIAYDKAQKEAAAEWAKERAQELADRMGIAMQTAAQAGIPAEPLTDEMGESIIPEKEQTVKPDAAKIRNEYAQRKILDATREHDSIRSAIQTYAETRRDREISKARREAHDRITHAINKEMPSGTAAQAQEIKEGKASERKLKTAADIANEKLKRARKAAKEIWNGDMYTKYLEASPEKRAEIESKYSDFKALAQAEKDYTDAKNAAKVRTKFTSKLRETMWGLSQMIEADGLEVFNRDAASYNAALTYLSAAASEAEKKAGGEYAGIFAKFAEANAEERAKMLDALPDDAKRDVRDLFKLMRVYGTLEAEVEALENAEADANSRWTEYTDSQIKNSGKLKKLEDTIKTYQNEADNSTYRGIAEKAAEDRKTADVLNSDVTDADVLLAQTFLDTVEEMTDAEREAENIVRAQIVAGNIISRDVISSMAETEESALNRMDEYRRTRDEEAMRIPEGLEKAVEQYKDSGYTEAEAILLAKRDARQEEQKARIAETAMGRLGYKIAGAIRDNYADAADLLDRKNKERNTMKTIRSYIKSNGIAPALETMAKDVALKKMMISETGLSGAQLTQVRALSALYEDYYSYVDGGIGAQGKSIAYDMVNRIDEIFDGFDWKNLKKVNQFLLNASNPQRVFEYVFGRGETADELRRTFIDPVIQNEAEKNRMDNRMIGKLNKYKITKAESGLVQAFAELRNIENTNPTSKGKEREKVFTRDVLRGILSGKTDVRKLVAELETANAFGEWANTDEGKQYLEDLNNGDVRESAADDTVSSSEEAYDELLQCLLDAQNEAKAKAKTAALDDYLKNGGTKDAWNSLPEAERNRLISEKQKAEAETKARTLERAADEMRNLLNNMYEALNEISVIHGRGEIKYRKDYMPHRQPEEARTKLEEMLRLYGFEPVSELPAEIAGQTENRKPNARWLPFAQERTGYKTSYDALGNVSSYIRIANSAIYHMDDIIKLRNLDVYLRTKFSKGEKNYKRSIYEQLYQNGLAVDDQAVADMLGNKVDDTNLSPLVVWLTEYANDLAGKQVLRGGVEKTFGRKALNLIAKNLQHSSAVMLAGNLSSSVKQISQMPKVFADTVKQTPAAIKAAFGKAGDIYDVAGRSTVLNEIEKQESISYFGEKSGIADKAAEIGSAANFFFNNMMNRYAVYAYFEQAMENGMDAEDAIAEADRKTRAILSSRMKGATPLLWRSKNPFVQLVTTFQRETVAQWENLLNESKDVRECYEKYGKDKTVSAVSKKLAAQLFAAFLFNSAMQTAGVGTPAMFDIIGIAKNLITKGGGVLWSIIAAALKEATDDDDEKLLSAEELIDAAAAGVENDLAIVKDEIADDIPFVNVVNTILGTAFGYDVTTNLPIQSVELGKFKTVGKNLKMLAEFRDELENATDADVIEEIERERADERTALALNLLTGVTDIAGSFVTAGNQLRKTVNGIATILSGGEYSRGGKAGELKYAIDDPADAVKAVLFGKSATKAAQEYFDSDYKTLSETNTDAYRNAMKNGAKSKEALNIVKEVSATQKTDGKTEKQVKAGIILQSNLPDDAKASLYFDMVATGSQQTAIATAQADGFDKDIDIVKAVNSVYNASLTGGKLEKVTALLNTGLSGGTMKDIYLSMIDSKKTLDDGTVTTYDTEKINALADVGIGFRSFLEIEQKYKEIDNEDVSASVKAAKLMNWALRDGYNREQTDVLSDTLTYSSGFRANVDKYEELIDAGVTPDHAVEIRTALAGLSTQNEKIGALIDLGYRQEETVNALKTIMTEKKYDSMVEALGEGVTLSDYYEFYESVDTNGNGSISNEERITALNRMNLTAKQKSALWKASGGSDKSNPYKSGIGSSGTFGASGTFGSGGTFGTSGTFGKTGTFGNGGTFKAGGTFGK